jgi:hypothetical protein
MVFIKIVLCILLLIGLLKMPYGYYQLERFIAMIGFALLASRAHEHNDNNEAIIYGGLALLFQPFIKIALGRQIWNVVDVIVAIGLVISILWKRK